MSERRRVLFVCGSPRGRRSASRATAEYLARFLDHDYEMVDLARPRLSADPTEADPAFRAVADKLRQADAIIWTFGAWSLFVPLEMQYLFEKLFCQAGVDLSGKLAAGVMTSVRVDDDEILERLRFVSEQLGLGYVGDVSAVGNPFFGYVEDEEITEDSCRALAGQLNRALAEGYFPARRYPAVEGRYLSPLYRGEGFAVSGEPAPKDAGRTVLVITGGRLAEDSAAASVVEAIRLHSRNRVETIALGDRKVGPCIGCYQCDFRPAGTCVLRDDYEAIKRQTEEADGIVFVGTCSAGCIDSRLKAFVDRSFGVAHRPNLQDKHGFAVAVGGGPLEAEMALYLQRAQGVRGIRCIGALSPYGSDAAGFAAELRRMVRDLDRAMDERWRIADRFGVRTSAWTYAKLASDNGQMLRADYAYHRTHRRPDAPSAAGGSALLRLLFKSKALETRLIAIEQARVERGRARRLADHLAAGGRLGEGQLLSSSAG